MSELGYEDNPVMNARVRSVSGFHCVDVVLSYWVALRGKRAAPLRSEIDPRAISGTLEHVFLADLVAPSVARLRIAGASYCDLLGMDVRGMPLTALFSGPARREASQAIEQVGDGVRVLLNVTAEQGFAAPSLRGTMALMPLADSTGRITRVMGVLGMEGTIGRRPRRFDIATPELLGPDDDRQPPMALPSRGAALTQSGQPTKGIRRAPAAVAARQPFLRVIEGGRTA